MTIDLSPKYQPLFDLLPCWGEVRRVSVIGLSEDEAKEYDCLTAIVLVKLTPNQRRIVLENIEYLRYYGLSDWDKKELPYWLELASVDTVISSGGRDSSKTFSTTLLEVVAAKDYNHRILSTRQTMSSTDKSITKAIDERMEALNCEGDFEYANNVYSAIGSKGEIVITGQKTSSGSQTAKLKSLENFSMFVTDESEELESYEEWVKIKRSIRPLDVQAISIIAFNPPTREHWLHEVFFEDAEVPEGFNGVKDGVLYIHTTYLDNIDHLAAHILKDYENLRLAYVAYQSMDHAEKELAPRKLKKQSEEYEHVVLGAFRNTADGVIFDNWELGAFNHELPRMGFGLDFGFDDPDVLVRCAVDEGEKKIYIKEELFQNGLGVDSLADIILDRVGYQHMTVGDSAHPRLIKQIRDRGVNIEKSRKGRGSVLRNIKTMLGYTIVIDPSSKNAIKGFSNYVWHDKRAGVPRNEYKHFPDALGYIAIELILF